jgi:hypothetical protein
VFPVWILIQYLEEIFPLKYKRLKLGGGQAYDRSRD